ncbi:MAG TPA: TIGR03620 family F420-dependent LLM class oxidoreductase [Acidimicrobiales bacterium]|nr:TIGR03620 family F420-dependent LLM class oxidoreductase [Acidimicrobiales bacterium]
MPKIDLGTIGAVVNPGEGFVDTVAAVEQLGYATIWLTGGPLEGLHQLAEAVRATDRARIASGIIAVDRFDADDVVALHADLETSHPGRFVLGLGGAHGARPIDTLNAYLDRLDAASIPASSRVLAALGPRMLDLARERAAGAFPVLVTAEYTARARARLGDDTTLAVEQLVVVDDDPDRARATAGAPLGFLGSMPQYQSSFRRQGFGDDEIAGRADRLVDALVPWGDADTVAARVSGQLAAGADHVAVSVTTPPGADPLDGFRRLADRLLT